MAGPSIAVKVLADLKGFTTAVSGAGAHVDGAAARMRGAFSGVTAGLNQTGILAPFAGTLDGINGALDAMAGHANGVGVAMLGVGGALTGIGAGLTAFGSKDQAAQQQLSAAIEATGGTFDDYGKAVEEAISHQEKYGHTASETQDALRLLTNATHDPQKALDMLGEASDIAASKHEDFSTAATQLGKVYNGNTKLLKEYGIIIDKTTGLTKDGQTATEALAKVTGGQAAAAADTFMGKLDGIKAKVEDSIAQFGQKYGPAIQVAGVAMIGLGAIVETLPALFGGLSTAWTVLTGIEYASLLPILGIVAAIALIGVGLYELVTNWSTVWGAIQAVVAVVWDWITSHWQLLLVAFTGGLGLIVVFFVDHFQQIKDFIAAVFDVIATIVDTWVGRIQALISNLVDWITIAFSVVWEILSVPFAIARDLIIGYINAWLWVVGGIAGVVGTAVATVAAILSTPFAVARDLISDAITTVIEIIAVIGSTIQTLMAGVENILVAPFQIAGNIINAIIGGIEDAIGRITGPLGKIFDAGGKLLGGAESLAKFAVGAQHGGVFTEPTLVLLGEAGPEAVVPLTGPDRPRAAGIGLGPSGPAVNIEHATFTSDVDIDLFMRRAAWAARSQAL